MIRQVEAVKARGSDTYPDRSVQYSADWVLANYHDVVAHFFTPDTRGIYDLEGLWIDAGRVSLPETERARRSVRPPRE